MSHTKHLSILLWNANGIRNHTNELTTLLHDKEIDVALITETRLTSKQHLNISQYNTYRTDHPDGRAHAGTAVIIHQSLSHHLFPLPVNDFLQATAVKVMTFSFPITIAAAYCPPNKPISNNQFDTFLNSLGHHSLLGADLNAKHQQWGSRTTNSRGRTLLSALNFRNSSIISPGTPTYWPTDPNRNPDLLDFFIHSGLNPLNHSIVRLDELSSDHSPLILTLSLAPIPKLPPPSFIRGPIDWNLFRQYIIDSIDLRVSLKTPQDLDDATYSFTNVIQQAVWTASSPRPFPKHRKKNPLPQDLVDLIQSKRHSRTLWQRTRHPDDRKSYNYLTKLLKKNLATFRSQSYNSYLSSLSSSDNSLWNVTKKILKYQPVSHPLRREDGTWAASDQKRAEEFANHLTSTFLPHSESHPTHTAKVNEFLTSPIPLSLPPKAVNPSEVKFLIKRLKPRKSPGYDLLTSQILRQLPQKAIIFLTYLYNCILRTTHFPLMWKHSTIILFLKPGKPPNNTSSYRPISLLPILSKIFEKILLKRILPILESQRIPSHQFGFRSNHSTVQQGLRVVDHISSSLESKQYCTGAFLDVAQAFDRVWHAGLLFKLKTHLPLSLYLILRSYLSNRTFRVRCSSEYSSCYPIEAGVPQGSVLGPILYILYTADIPTTSDTFLATFADDTAILSSHPDPETASYQLQRHLSLIEVWCNQWRIKVNELKCKHVTFTLRRKSCPPIFFNDTPLPISDTVRYLGFLLDKRLTWNPHTRLKRQELNRRFSQLYRLLSRSSHLSLNNKLLIYKTILKPIWTYGLELWGTAKHSNIKRIQSFQSKVLRTIVNAPYYVTNRTLHNDLNIPFVLDLIPLKFSKFHQNLSDHPNPLAQSLSSLNHPYNPPRRLKRQWPRDLL
ncbi:reverse transcriptase family protein [Pantoea sp. Taur]|uniref:reverse transcriptase family protein n=1 Tax=Pantoea sp. Taur TaxID=2576757 RepID=UPI001355FF8E|nr:hypothetical protein [Pantoea sp. Taur]